MTPHIQIDDDVPIPPSRIGCFRSPTGFNAALRALDVGHSAVYPQVASESVNAAARAAGARANQVRRQTGHKYRQRQVVENGVTVVRVWRVA